jgi:hypothetical protein
MPLFSCFQSFGISYLEVGLSLSWEVLCLVRKDYYVDWIPSAARRRGVHIANVLPGPRPRTGFRGGDVKHCRRPSRYVLYKGTFVPYDGTYGAPD